MIIKSTSVLVRSNQETVYKFLTDSTNLLNILPQDKISDWRATNTECSFKVQGGITISLNQNGGEGLEKVFMKSGSNTPFPFKLTLFVNKIDENTTEGYIEFDGEVNMFLKMMVEKPLTNLFNYMSEKLKEYYDLKN